MSVFSTASKVESHKKKSDNIFNVFKSTVANLATTNLAIDKDIEVENTIIATAQASKKAMEAIKTDNDKFIGKINEFFELG